MVELKLLLFTVPVGFNTFFIRAILAGWIFTTVGFPDAASHAGTKKPLHLMIIFAWDMVRGKTLLKTRLTCQSLKGPLRWLQILSICWLTGQQAKKKCMKEIKSERKKKKEKQLGSCSMHWVCREVAALQVTILYKLYGHALNQQGSKGWEGEGGGGGWGFSISQFTNELRLSGPGQTLGRSIWERLTGGFNEHNDQSHDHLCCGRAHQKKRQMCPKER